MPRAFTHTLLHSLSKDDTNPHFALSQEKSLICHSEQAQCQHNPQWNISGKCTEESQTTGNSTGAEKASRSPQITGPGAAVAKAPHPCKDQEHQPAQEATAKQLMHKWGALKDRV